MSRHCVRRLQGSVRFSVDSAVALQADGPEPVHSWKGKEPLRNANELRSTVKSRIARQDASDPFSTLPPSAHTPLARHPLKDTFARKHTYLRISLTERCNLRCTYCMPAEGVPLSPSRSILTDDEVVRLAEVFVRHGVDKVRLTGGEPTLRKGLPGIIERLNELEGLRKICMTSNGIALHRKLPDLVQRGLTHLNLSLDTLCPDRFELVTRRRGHSAVLSSLDTALSLPLTVKLNTVLTRDFNLDEMLSFVRLTRNRPLAVRFIEFMPFSGNSWDKQRMVPYNEALALLRREFGTDLQPLEAEDNDGTSKRWKIKGWAGEIGFISSMSDHFCGTCNRLRITADGNLKVCLFDHREVSLRDVLRHPSASPTETDRLLTNVIGQAVGGKQAKHAGVDLLAGWSTHTLVRQKFHLRLPRRYRSPHRLAVRHSHSSAKFTHVDDSGRASMVSIADKRITVRRATAEGRIWLNQPAYDLLAAGKNPKKGDVLGTARIAGIMAGKRTSELIPLCHPIGLTDLKVRFALSQREEAAGDQGGGGWVHVQATAECEGKTGVEMEALTAASTSLLTIWDMIKAVSGKEMVIEGLRVTRKEGGKSGDWQREKIGEEDLEFEL